MLTACTSNEEVEPSGGREFIPYVAVYFHDGRALIPEYRRLSETRPIDDLLGSLVAGPISSRAQTAMDPDVRLVSDAETGQGLLLELNDAFWDEPRARVRMAAAQIVYTMAGIEEGKEVTLLDGLVPGPVVRPDGGRLTQPLDRDEFRSFRPWIEVIHPVAGALVANPLPVNVSLRRDTTVQVKVIADGEVVGRGTGTSVGWQTDEMTGTVRVVAGDHRVDVPVRFRL